MINGILILLSAIAFWTLGQFIAIQILNKYGHHLELNKSNNYGGFGNREDAYALMALYSWVVLLALAIIIIRKRIFK